MSFSGGWNTELTTRGAKGFRAIASQVRKLLRDRGEINGTELATALAGPIREAVGKLPGGVDGKRETLRFLSLVGEALEAGLKQARGVQARRINNKLQGPVVEAIRSGNFNNLQDVTDQHLRHFGRLTDKARIYAFVTPDIKHEAEENQRSRFTYNLKSIVQDAQEHLLVIEFDANGKPRPVELVVDYDRNNLESTGSCAISLVEKKTPHATGHEATDAIYKSKLVEDAVKKPSTQKWLEPIKLSSDFRTALREAKLQMLFEKNGDTSPHAPSYLAKSPAAEQASEILSIASEIIAQHAHNDPEHKNTLAALRRTKLYEEYQMRQLFSGVFNNSFETSHQQFIMIRDELNAVLDRVSTQNKKFGNLANAIKSNWSFVIDKAHNVIHTVKYNQRQLERVKRLNPLARYLPRAQTAVSSD